MSGHTKGTVSLAAQPVPPYCPPTPVPFSTPLWACLRFIRADLPRRRDRLPVYPLGDLLAAVYLAPVICHIPDERSGACEMPPRREEGGGLAGLGVHCLNALLNGGLEKGR